MRMIRYMVWVLIASVAVWAVGCGSGAGAPDQGLEDAELRKKLEAEGAGADPNLAPPGQQRFKEGGEAPESSSETPVDTNQ